MSTNEQGSALKVHKLTFWEATMIVVGANVGSGILLLRSEERRVGKECRSRWSPYH